MYTYITKSKNTDIQPWLVWLSDRRWPATRKEPRGHRFDPHQGTGLGLKKGPFQVPRSGCARSNQLLYLLRPAVSLSFSLSFSLKVK